MRIHVLLIAIILSGSVAWAERGAPSDDLSKAYEAAVVDLNSGKDRQGIIDRFKPVLEKLPNSGHARLARPFLDDLIATAKNPPAKPNDPPEKRLADSRFDMNVLRSESNWDKLLKLTLAKLPDDPCTKIVTADRAVITRLIPLLGDRTPSRCEPGYFGKGQTGRRGGAVSACLWQLLRRNDLDGEDPRPDR